MANRVKFTDSARTQFLEVLARTCNVTHAARTAGISRSRVYELRKEDAEFAADWQDAEETAIDALEGEARRRAYDGVDEPVVYRGTISTDEKGQPVTVKRYSDTLIIFLLKAHRPEKYRERFDTKVQGPEHPTVADADDLSDEQLLSIAMGRPVLLPRKR